MSHTLVRPSGRRPRRRIVVLAVVATLTPAACGDSIDDPAAEAAADEASAERAPSADSRAVPFGLVSPVAAAELATDPSITVIDVRTPEEFGAGHLDGATMIDFYADTFADEISELDPDETYLVYCRSGNRSGQTAAMLAELGFAQIYDLDGGVIAWEADGLPLVP